jgi:transposase
LRLPGHGRELAAIVADIGDLVRDDQIMLRQEGEVAEAKSAWLKDKIATLREQMRKYRAIVAIDGSRFKAVNSRDRSFSRGSIERRIEQVDASIERYLSALETADRRAVLRARNRIA